MTSISQMVVRQCRECGRPASPAGTACAYCGGQVIEVAHKHARPLPEERKHPQVMAAAITFCVMLLVVRVLFGLWYPKSVAVWTLAGGDAMLWLQGIATGMTVMYIFLRMDEGDFRALFFASLALFAGEETLCYLADAVGLPQFQRLGEIMGFSVAIFAALALTAAAYDPPRDQEDPRRTPLVYTCLAMMLVAGLRAFGGMAGAQMDNLMTILATLILAMMVVYLILYLLRTGRSNGMSKSDPKSEPKSDPNPKTPPPGPSAVSGPSEPQGTSTP